MIVVGLVAAAIFPTYYFIITLFPEIVTASEKRRARQNNPEGDAAFDYYFRTMFGSVGICSWIYVCETALESVMSLSLSNSFFGKVLGVVVAVSAIGSYAVGFFVLVSIASKLFYRYRN